MKITTIRNLFLSAIAVAALGVSSLGMSSPGRADDTVTVGLGGDAGGKMVMTVDKTSVKAGKITFNVANSAAATEHEMVVIKLKSKTDELPMMDGMNMVDEDKLQSMGEVSELKPGTNGSLSTDMPAGDYLLMCNVKGHYKAGMFSPFTVTP